MKFVVKFFLAIVLLLSSSCNNHDDLLTSESTTEIQVHPELIASDIDLIRNFLDALYRPNQTSFRVICDASAQKGLEHIPLLKRNRILSDRLSQFKRPPRPILKINLYSIDIPRPLGSGHFVYSYNTLTGKFVRIGIYQVKENSVDMSISITRRLDGGFLVSLNNTWINDFKENAFFLRAGEQTFRFAIAVERVN